jgi:hypothetical protein
LIDNNNLKLMLILKKRILILCINIDKYFPNIG